MNDKETMIAVWSLLSVPLVLAVRGLQIASPTGQPITWMWGIGILSYFAGSGVVVYALTKPTKEETND